MSANHETWQVMCDAGIFETDMEGLREWAREGRILPTDKVRKGNLRWIEAGLAPVLRGTFAAKASPALSYSHGVEAAATTTTTTLPDTATPLPEPKFGALPRGEEFIAEEHLPPPDEQAHAFEGDAYAGIQALNGPVCYNHPYADSKYICRACDNTFCANCPKRMSINVWLCPLCGELCNLYEEVRARSERRLQQSAGFGFDDFGKAIGYPFKNWISLIFGTLLYSFLLFAGFKGQLLASAILFGCMSLVINKVATGRMDKDFLPDLSEFSLWDDFIVRIFLSIGITIVTLGPAILITLLFIFGIVRNAPERPSQPQLTEEEQQQLLEGTSAQSMERLQERMEREETMERDAPVQTPLPKATDVTETDESPLAMFRWLWGAPLILLPFLLLALLWAFFYYPMALTVAGYTEDFWSVINPLVGLDTIRRMGLTYFKAFGMYLAVQAVGSFISLVTYLVLSPFNMPFVGNLPARFVNGSVTFYTSLVIACILGLALYKCADRLDIATD